MALGVSALADLTRREVLYESWECDCPKSPKTGFPTRHYWQYLPGPTSRHGSRYAIMIAPGRGEMRQARGEGGLTDAPVDGTECRTWRYAVRTIRRDCGSDRVCEPSAPLHRAGPLTSLRALTIADLPARCTARRLLPYATSAHTVTGRMIDDGPIVERYRLSGTTRDGLTWCAYWTDGSCVEARLGGLRTTFTALRARVRA